MPRLLALVALLSALLAPALARADDPKATLDRLCAVAKEVEQDRTVTDAERADKLLVARVDEELEVVGLDLSDHEERGYDLT